MILKTIKVIKKGSTQPVKVFVKEDVLDRIVKNVVKSMTALPKPELRRTPAK